MSDSYWQKNENLLKNEEEKSPWWSSRPVLIVFLAVVSIIILSILWHALLPSKPQGNVEVPYVKAETGAVKVQPEHPGGAEIPHRDKMVYDLISDSAHKEGKSEVLQPVPEKPLYDTKFENPLELSERKDKIAVEDVKPLTIEEQPAEESLEQVSQPVEKSVQEKAKTDKIPDVKPQKVAGKYRVQVASLGSQKAAEGQMRALKKKHASLKSTSLTVIKGSVKGKTVYRVQAGSFQTRDQAMNLCKKIKQEGGQCLLAS